MDKTIFMKTGRQLISGLGYIALLALSTGSIGHGVNDQSLVFAAQLQMSNKNPAPVLMQNCVEYDQLKNENLLLTDVENNHCQQSKEAENEYSQRLTFVE